jgi:hypothetical protein
MKRSMFATAAVAAVLVIGCNEQSSVNSPISERSDAPVLAKVNDANKFEINETLVDELTGESYVVSGVVNFEYAKEGGEYSFMINPMLDVRNSLAHKKQRTEVDQKIYHSGILEESALVLHQDFQLSGISNRLYLRISFSVYDEVSITGVSIRTEPPSADEDL